MKPHVLFLMCALLLLGGSIGCRSPRAATDDHPVQRYLPAQVRDLYFGLPLAEFLQQTRTLSRAEPDNSFRTVLVEELSRGPVQTAVYYFDRDGDEPLYELILLYPDTATRNAETRALFGPPNHEGSEWRYDSGEGYPLWAWTFQQKLVIAAVLPGTEWADEK